MNTHTKWKRILARLRPAWSLTILIILIAFTFVYGMFQGGFVSWFIFYSFLPFALYSILVFLYPLQDFQVERSISRSECNAGETLSVKLTIKRNLPFPLAFLVVEDILPEECISNGHKQMIFPIFKRIIHLSYTIPTVPRGEHSLQTVRMKIGDSLGFVEKERWFECIDTILVYPKYEEMLYQSLNSRYEQGGTSITMQFQKDTTLISGVRQYQPGDRFSWIDWKATARTNEMVSKEFEMKQTNDILLILDQSKSPHFEESISFTASLARTILRHGGRVGLISSGKGDIYQPIRSGEAQQRQIFHHLAKVKSEEKHSFKDVFKKESFFYKPKGVMIVITCTLNKQLIDVLVGSVKGKGTIIVYCVGTHAIANEQETAILTSIALQKGIIFKTVYDNQFQTALVEVGNA